MKANRTIAGWLVLLALSTFNLQPSTCFAQGTAFTYQGRLNSEANPANGLFDLRFTMCDAAANGNAVGGFVTNAATPVSNGLFAVSLDFGGVFDGNARWLEIAVRTNGASSFVTLAPRQPLTPAPYALYAAASKAVSGSVSVSQLSGTVAATNLPSNLASLDANQTFNGQNAFKTAVVDPFANNNGTVLAGLTFGGLASSEGIGSKRTAGGNQYGLDFYTYSTARMSITSGGNVGIGKNNPATALDVNGTVTATNFVGSAAGLTNLNLPNGSIGLAKLGSDVQFARAPFVTGVTSSPPQQLTWRISIDGAVTDPPATVAAPYKEDRVVINAAAGQQYDNIYDPIPGRLEPGKLILRRKVSEDPTWLNYRLTWYTNQTLVRHTVRLELIQGAATLGRWTFTRGVVCQHNYRLAADNLPVEEIALAFETNVARVFDPAGNSVPAGPGPQVSFTSGQSAGASYGVRVDGTNWIGTGVVGSDVSESSDSAVVLPAYAIRLENTKPGLLVLRQSPGAQNDLWNWYYSVASSGTATTRTIELYLGHFLLQHCLEAYPTSYTLAIGDDGLPYEEYGIVYTLNP